ncbi:hypothetical protein HX025_11270 [Myroides odoratimimus]|uniref:hypothetical protein n=1 Tax=Myroides odoratimimus TaxID=76832 RepID=UPI00257561F5|nr:hypothetical protein [Myroides odoratimimus]MDM1401225.1 hypothetical protein [Myroides odoratimimus]MDM1457225.1 hypothetical protein [Myroides odoratimimus]MEC4085756.1 hypothetical protein [Myroides odoratimimus]
MKESTISPEALRSYQRLQRKRYNSLVCIGIEIIVYMAIIAFVFFANYYHFRRVRIQVGNDNPMNAYLLFLLLILCALVRVIILYIDKIPVLSKLQERMEKREFERLKKTYQYQVRLNHHD